MFNPSYDERRTAHISHNSTHKTVQDSAPKRRGFLVLALLVAAFLTVACAPPESNGITNSPHPPSPLKQITGRAFNGNTITYYTIDTAARAALTPQGIGITDISGDVEYTIEQVGTSGQVGYIADISAIQPSKANPNTLEIPQGTTGFFTVQVKAKNAKRDAAMPSKKVLIAAGRIDVGAKLAMPDASKKENITLDAAAKKVRINVLEAGTKFTIVQFPDEAPKYDLTYSAEGVGDNNIVKAIDPTTGEITQGDVGSGNDIGAIKARTADITVKVTAEAVGPYPALKDTTLFTVEHYRWMRVASGTNHTLAINSRGELYAWGSNKNGQLGIGTTTDNELAPQRVGGDSDWKAVSGGKDHSLALKNDGTLYAWGKNDRGQLGIGSTENKTTPQRVGSADDWKAISAGLSHSLALKIDNTLYAMGGNLFGELGNGENNADLTDTSKDKTAPIQIGTDRNWQTISASSYYSVALKDNGDLYTWGHNAIGQLGDGTDGAAANKNSPTRISTGWQSVSAGGLHVLAIKTDNTLYSWGYNRVGQLGDGTDGAAASKNSPTKVGSAADWKAVAGGDLHSLALKSDSTLYAWGHNDLDALGLGNASSQIINNPAKVSSDTNWKAIDGGEHFSLALKDNGTLYAMGISKFLGIGTATPQKQTSPTPVPHP